MATFDGSLLITVNSASAHRMVTGWNMQRITVCYAPFDLRWVIRRILRRFKVLAYVGIEAEFWLNRFDILHKSGVPVTLVGARLSAKSSAKIQRLRIAQTVLSRSISFVSPQDEGSAKRFQEIGLQERLIGPVLDLKELYQPPPKLPQNAVLSVAYPRSTTILAASVHVEEDVLVAQAFAKAHQENPALRLIIAPRHPDRIDPLLAWLTASDLPLVRHSLGEVATANTVITLADTLGEMARWYDLAGLCFVGGSWVDKGGHTPFEPIAHGCLVLHGPSTFNFEQTYKKLDADGVTQQIETPEQLVVLLNDLNGDQLEKQRREMATYSNCSGDLAALVAIVCDKQSPLVPRH